MKTRSEHRFPLPVFTHILFELRTAHTSKSHQAIDSTISSLTGSKAGPKLQLNSDYNYSFVANVNHFPGEQGSTSKPVGHLGRACVQCETHPLLPSHNSCVNPDAS
ncbi:hypothetical protein RRG08_032960 [Elysia crispata]|uniref:Uncharacterized protein n=1 Tax=Elysia crispata TaxID=231223 RepID=A0AAE0YS79_9GAST|nr:hypothetical protein RRG08_032960 [Elysia crispata]